MSYDQYLFNQPVIAPKGVRTPIYPIGDSHIRVLIEVAPYVFKNSETDIVVAVFESKSAYAVGSDGHDWYLNEKLQSIPDGEVVLLSFGEIDCRHYVPSMAKQNGTTIEQEVEKVIARYIPNCVRLLKEKFRVAIMGAYMCPNDVDHQNKVAGENINNSYEEILKAKELFNSKMSQYCQIEGLLYVPLFEAGMKFKWHLDKEKYFTDDSHLGKIMIHVIFEYMKNFKWKNFDYE